MNKIFIVLDCNPLYPTMPIAVFLSTDGLDDCFEYYKNSERLFKFYTILIESMIDMGLYKFNQEISDNVLSQMSAKGSMDDISLAYLITDKDDLLKEVYDRIKVSVNDV